MLYTLIRKSNSMFAESTKELLLSTSRTLIYILGAFYLAWQLKKFFLEPQDVNMHIFPLTALVVVTFGLALFILPHHYFLSHIIWYLGMSASIVYGLWLTHIPEGLLFFALIPLIAASSIGWLASLAAELVVIGLVSWIQYQPVFIFLPASYPALTILSGVLLGLLGWASTSSFLTIAQWSIDACQQALTNMEEARNQRVELFQTQEDLLKANKELARLSERLKVLSQAAEEARRVKEEFVSNISHELRTPLNMIIGFCDIITQSPKVYSHKLPPMLLADITAIQRNSQHLQALVNDVLDLSQIEAGRMALSKQKVIIQEVIQQAVEGVSALFESKGLYLKCELPETPVQVLCDVTRIREVILNLLSNAGRFTTRGGVLLKTCIESDHVVISLADTGPGIAPEDQARLFEPFIQLDNSIRRKVGGSGLGLSISKHFVEMHGGKMWLESDVNRGTTFFFSLPFELPVEQAPKNFNTPLRWANPFQLYEERTRRSKAQAPVVNRRYVIVEAGDTLLHYFQRYMDGVEVQSVKDLHSAAQALANSPAQAVILNSQIEEQYSLEAPLDLSNIPFDTPLIICWVPGSEEAARRLGVVRYLVKPIARKDLLGALEDLHRPVKTILLVEDNTEALQLFTRILASAENKYTVIRAMNGQQAIDFLHERRPDVMLLDLMMPGVDGFQVLKEKSRDAEIKDIPVIVISSLDPSGAPIVSKNIAITRSGGFSVKDLLACIQVITDLLTMAPKTADPTPTKMPPA